jgi:hypothetical protein
MPTARSHDFVGNVGNAFAIPFVGNVGNLFCNCPHDPQAWGRGRGGTGVVGHVGNVGIPTEVGGAPLYARLYVLCA